MLVDISTKFCVCYTTWLGCEIVIILSFSLWSLLLFKFILGSATALSEEDENLTCKAIETALWMET